MDENGTFFVWFLKLYIQKMGVVSLKAHQKAHASRILQLLTCTPGGGVALDVSPTGTGKTYAAAWVVAQLSDHHVVVVCPTIVRRTWATLVPEAKIITYGMLTLGATKTGVVVPDMRPRVLDLKGDLEALLSRPKTLLVVDEVHRARHVASQTSRALCAMCERVQAAEGGRVLCLSATFMDGMSQVRLLPRLYPRSFAEFEASTHEHHEMMGCRGREREARAVLCRVLGVPEGREGEWLLYARKDPYFSRIADKYEGRSASAERFLRSASKPFCPFCVLSFLESIRTAMGPNPEAEGKNVEDVYLEGSSTLSESMRLRAFYAYMDASSPPHLLPRSGKRPRCGWPDLSIVPAPLTGPPAAHMSGGSARVDLPSDFDFVQRTDWTLSSDEAYEAWRSAQKRYEIMGRADLAWSASVPLLMLDLARASSSSSSSSNGVGLRALQEVESRKACGLARHVHSRLREGSVVEVSGEAKRKVVVMFNFLEPMRTCGRELERLLALDGYDRERGLVAQISGDTPARTRHEIVEAFRASSGGPLCILCTMGTMKEGVSLHDERGVCPRELYIMPNFSSISLIQASGRVHRENAASASKIFRVYGQEDSGGSVEKSLEQRLESKRRTMILLGTSASETAVLVGKHFQGGGVMAADLRAWLVDEYTRRMDGPRRDQNELVLGKYRWLASRMRPCFSPVGTSHLWNPLDKEDELPTMRRPLPVSPRPEKEEEEDSGGLDERPSVSDEHDAILHDIFPVTQV
jgi:hypothetical protein